jgi:transcriptional regulator with XRE-family HTH domain
MKTPLHVSVTPHPASTTYSAVVGCVLLQAREACNLTQEDVAKAAGVSQPTWSKLERGLSALGLDQLRLAALALHTAPSVVLAAADLGVAALQRRGVVVDAGPAAGALTTRELRALLRVVPLPLPSLSDWTGEGP